MTVRFAVLLGAGVLAASGAMAETPASPDTNSGKPAAAAKPAQPLECRNEEISGSRVRKVKVCKTAEKWEEQGRRAQEGWKRQNRSAPGVGGQTLPRPGG